MNMILTHEYKEGYMKGRWWNDNWRPGGPWFCRCDRCAEKSEVKRKNWQQGFNAGFAVQQEENQHAKLF